MPSNSSLSKGPSPYIAWVNIARTLSLAFAYTIMGRLSDLFGRRWFYLIGNIISLLGIIVSATAQNVDSLIVGAAVAGLGETVQLSFNVALGELVPNKYRPLVISFIFFMTAPFTTFGPTLGMWMNIHGAYLTSNLTMMSSSPLFRLAPKNGMEVLLLHQHCCDFLGNHLALHLLPPSDVPLVAPEKDKETNPGEFGL